MNLINVFHKWNTGRRIKKLAENLDAVDKARSLLPPLQEMAMNKRKEISSSRETGSTLSQSRPVYGRERDSEIIIDLLVNNNNEQEELSVLPVIGVGGVGKTCLAQLVFNHPRIVEHFEKRLWVHVSDTFDLTAIVKAMIESAGEPTSDLTRLDSLQRRLVELLSHKKYLTVLDDVWNEDQHKWSDLRNVLACGSAGSSIVVTTRSRMVAEMMCTLRPYELMGLEDELCWRLLLDCAFGRDEQGRFPNLEAIGRRIASRCAGVPLAAKALGGLLRFKRTEDEWNYVMDSEIWELPSQGGLTIPSLRLSYHHLPLHMRQCFAYCGVFPKHSEIKKDELLLMWMANGYISSHGALEVEDVANGICDELVLRSLLQYNHPDETTLIMHDLVHDLAQSILESKVPGQLNVGPAAAADHHRRIRQANLRRKFVAFPPTYEKNEMEMSSVLARYSRLRALDASCTGLTHLESGVSNLRHLRRLNLSETKIRSLPDSVCSLWNLEVLDLNSCEALEALPKKLRKLVNLRHLFLDGCESLRNMPPKMRKLTRLRTLTLFIVDHGNGNQLAELQSLNLGDRITIRSLEKVENQMDAKRANLSEKKRVQSLKLEWANGGEESSLGERVLEALEPHSNLQTLEIQGFRGAHFPAWMSSSILEKLVEVRLSDCIYCAHLPQLGDLPNLKSMSLAHLPIRYIDEGDHQVDEDGQFPSLEILHLEELHHLRAFSKQEGITLFPDLEELLIADTSVLDLSALSSLDKLQTLVCGSPTLASLPKLDSVALLEVHMEETMQFITAETLQNLNNLEELRIFEASESSLNPV